MCAIFGMWNARNAAELTAIGLHNNQHRAIDYAGMVSCHQDHFHLKQGPGLARQVFTEEAIIELPGNSALGHIRYPTVIDDRSKHNIQPIIGHYGDTPFAVAHNGNFTNAEMLKVRVFPSRLFTSTDTELMVRLFEDSYTGDLEKDLLSVLSLLQGSFSMAILFPDRLLALRDPQGNRPLSVATHGDGYCISSETCAFPGVGASEHFEVEPGTLVSITNEGIKTGRYAPTSEKKCRFEGIYYSHPSSIVFGEQVARFRISLGKALEESCPVEGGADIVTPIPDSSNFIAMGYAHNGKSGEYFPVITRNHYVGRTFIAATHARRHAEVAQKFAFSAEEIVGKRIVVVDDSIVRCTTLPKIIETLQQLGAKAVHVRIGSPPIKYPCRYGINTPNEAELIASSHSPQEICDRLGADSLEFIPLEVLKGLSSNPERFCFACMTGEYW